ncbi:MAG: hypothetical protein LBG65_06260 [Puniceicoccales bacterium]|nr:hypothetical protein [Puniceicoccales bacterium]
MSFFHALARRLPRRAGNLPGCGTGRALGAAALVFAVAAAGQGAWAPAARAQSIGGEMRPPQLSEAGQAETLQRFRSLRLADSCFHFTITHIPRRGGQEVAHKGIIWTSWRDGPVFRIELERPAGSAEKTPLRYILKGGKNAAIWGLDAAGKPARLNKAANQPFFPGLIITPLELQQPFAYWQTVEYDGTRRFRGRPTHFFKMLPPGDFKRAHPEIGFVRIGIDKGYDSQVLMQASIFNDSNDEVRRLEIESFNSIKGVYIPEELRLLDLRTRDRDVFRVTKAAVLDDARYAQDIYAPATLGATPPLPPPARFTKID